MAFDEFGLSTKQRLFCEYYLNNGYNATQAASDAGYSKISAKEIGRENLTKPLIQKYMSNRMEEVFEKIGAGIDWRADMLKKTAEASYEGRASKDGRVNANGVVSSISEMNKMAGAYAPEKKDINVSKVDELVNQFESEF